MDMAIGGIGTYSNNEYDVTVAKASTDGTWQWAQTLVGNGNERHREFYRRRRNGLPIRMVRERPGDGQPEPLLGWNGTDTGLWSDSHGFVALSDAGGDG